MIKAINKGYTLTVTSWENDGDNYNTKSITVDTKEKAKAIHDLCINLFKSHNTGEGGIGNMMDNEDEEAMEIIIPYMQNHPELYEDNENINDDTLFNICNNYSYDLMGSSEYYSYRVVESCVVTYSPEDVYVEEIKF